MGKYFKLRIISYIPSIVSEHCRADKWLTGCMALGAQGGHIRPQLPSVAVCLEPDR